MNNALNQSKIYFTSNHLEKQGNLVHKITQELYYNVKLSIVAIVGENLKY